MPARPGAGRPTKYSPEVVKRITDALRGGNTRRAACAAGGIDQTTFGTWLKENSDFSHEVEKAEGEAELRNLAVCAELIVKSAKRRHESRGLHYTLDYPKMSKKPRQTVIEGYRG